MGTVLLENITGVRVIRAFRKEKDEEARMQKTFSDYADTSIKASQITDLTSADAPAQAENDEVLSFRHVYFRYADAEANTLHDLDFVCRKGQTTAIIGGTGSGKSIVASLILRFHDVTSGSVCLNGTDIRDITQAGLRSRLSYVQQKAWLFSGTIAENLRYSNPDATDEELWHALEVAQARDFVEKLPEGLNARVAQGGTSFSALDFQTDAALRKALAEETKDAAVLIIAQRVSSIRHAEWIVVLNQGEIAGTGTHDELMKSCTVYKEIADSQTKEAGE